VARRIVRRAGIVSLGRYMPSRVLTNADLETMVDTTNEWILERTGIRERRLVREGEHQSDLAFKACREALDRVGVKPSEIDQVIVATVTPDHIFPSSANTLAGKLGIIGAPSNDITAACSGFVYALHQGVCAVECGRANRVLVVGSEVMSKIVDWNDRNTCVLFGDGAAAVLIEPVREPYGIVDITIGSDGRYYDILHMSAGGSDLPASHDTVNKRQHYLSMSGPEVFKLAVRQMGDVAATLLERNRLRPHDLSCFIAHQANERILEATAKRIKLRPNQVFNNIQWYGNTTSATIPSCMYDAESIGMIKRGGWVMIVTFGGGLTWGGALMRWAAPKLPKPEPELSGQSASEIYSDSLKPGQDWNRR
jgi:3-oxoacyl-[acyl-carrier-protein] synthase III